MRPVLFKWRSLTVWSYPAMVYLGLVAGVVAGNVAAHAAGLNAFRVYVATLILFVPSLIGAKLFFVVSHWRHYRQGQRRIFNPQEGGAAQYGGLLLVLPSSIPVLAALHLRVGSYWDVGIFTILVLMIFGRIGCLLNGCCGGRPSGSRLSLRLPNDSGVWDRRIPTQFLEIGLALFLLFCAIAARRLMLFPGALFLLVTAGYAFGRVFLEFTRESYAGRFSIHQSISVALVIVSVTALIVRWP